MRPTDDPPTAEATRSRRTPQAAKTVDAVFNSLKYVLRRFPVVLFILLFSGAGDDPVRLWNSGAAVWAAFFVLLLEPVVTVSFFRQTLAFIGSLIIAGALSVAFGVLPGVSPTVGSVVSGTLAIILLGYWPGGVASRLSRSGWAAAAINAAIIGLVGAICVSLIVTLGRALFDPSDELAKLLDQSTNPDARLQFFLWQCLLIGLVCLPARDDEAAISRAPGRLIATLACFYVAIMGVKLAVVWSFRLIGRKAPMLILAGALSAATFASLDALAFTGGLWIVVVLVLKWQIGSVKTIGSSNAGSK